MTAPLQGSQNRSDRAPCPPAERQEGSFAISNSPVLSHTHTHTLLTSTPRPPNLLTFPRSAITSNTAVACGCRAISAFPSPPQHIYTSRNAMASSNQVTWEDQQNINKFSNLFARQGELEEQLKEQKKVVDDVDDASAELMLADEDEGVRMRVGDCFWLTDKKAAEQKLEQLGQEAQAQYTRLEQQLAEVNASMAELRTQLYARLGDSINLDVPASRA